jgi:hypothetical protein
MTKKEMTNILILTTFLAVSLISCSQPSTVSKAELMEITTHWKEPKVAIWYYMGTDNKFHYFRFIDLGTKQEYRVRRNELQIDETYRLSKKQNEWRVMPWGSQAIMKKES